jgi:hypothetical protein
MAAYSNEMLESTHNKNWYHALPAIRVQKVEKLSLCWIKNCHNDVWGSAGIDEYIINLSTTDMSDEFHA